MNTVSSSAAAPMQFQCDVCAKSYRWKPELAGKRVKCKCGHTMAVPQPPSTAPTSVPLSKSDDPFGDALAAMADAEEQGRTTVAESEVPRCPSCSMPLDGGAVLCVNCGHNLKTGAKVPTSAARVAAVPAGGPDIPVPAAGAVAARGPASPMLMYAAAARRRLEPEGRSRGNNNIGDPIKDLYVPIALFALGVALTFCEGRYGLRIPDLGVAILYTGLMVVVNVVLVFAAMMAAVKMLDLGLGPAGPALIKIAAVAVLPGAVATLLPHLLGFSGLFVMRGASLLLMYAMLMGLMELDGHETRICAAIIWIVRIWLGYFLVLALLSAMGAALGPRAGALAAAAANSGSTGRLKSPTKPKPTVTAAQLDALALKALKSPGATEARDWVAAGTPEHPRIVPRIEDVSPAQQIERLYGMGATRIVVTRTGTDNNDLVCEQLVMTLPKDPDARAWTFEWDKSDGREMNFKAYPDVGQQYLLVDYKQSYWANDAEKKKAEAEDQEE